MAHASEAPVPRRGFRLSRGNTLPAQLLTLMVLHRGYRISIERQFSNWRVYTSPTYPSLPILSRGDFVWKGKGEDDALLEAMRRIDELLARTRMI